MATRNLASPISDLRQPLAACHRFTRSMSASAPAATRFEQMVAKLGLRKSQISRSAELRQWATQYASRYYVPEELLVKWGIDLTDDDSFYLCRESRLGKEATCRA